VALHQPGEAENVSVQQQPASFGLDSGGLKTASFGLNLAGLSSKKFNFTAIALTRWTQPSTMQCGHLLEIVGRKISKWILMYSNRKYTKRK
jgi:hypothetical protein